MVKMLIPAVVIAVSGAGFLTPPDNVTREDCLTFLTAMEYNIRPDLVASALPMCVVYGLITGDDIAAAQARISQRQQPALQPSGSQP